jgi:pyruvate/2-oxoglutarate dehydrogenase complex dihydrolipoamide dehydrogenase (E3) component
LLWKLSRITFNANQNTMRMLRVFHVEVLQGSASFVDQNRVQLPKPDGTTTELCSTAVVIATGAQANRLPQIDFTLPGVFDSEPGAIRGFQGKAPKLI